MPAKLKTKKECILLQIIDDEFNKSYEARAKLIKSFIHYPIDSLAGVHISSVNKIIK